MILKYKLSALAVLAVLISSPSVYAENYIGDDNKAKIVSSHPFLGVEPDGALDTMLAYFERMGYEKTQDKFDEVAKSRVATFQIRRPPQLIKLKITDSEELGKRTIEFKGSNPDSVFVEQVTDIIVNDLCNGEFEKRRAPDNNAALSCITRPTNIIAVKAKAKDGNGVKYNLSFMRRGDKKMDLIYYRENN
ncbi:MAG: hypothetical protein JJ879_09735 [Sneathiella sp.]|nr:hypothetical protein [Sneathiella sp.]